MVEAIIPDLLELARSLQNELVEMRRAFHISPELAFAEHDTAKLCAERLTQYGFTVKMVAGGTGIIADYGGGRTVAIRADMDGLALAEMNSVVYRSQRQNVMHACGHDVHMACVLGAAKLIAANGINGRVRIIMQPGEESVSPKGSLRMIDDGALTEVDYVLGLHVDSTLPAGLVGVLGESASFLGSDFEISVSSADEQNAVQIASGILRAIFENQGILGLEKTEVVPSYVRATTQGREALIKGSIEYADVRGFEAAQKKLDEICRQCCGETYSLAVRRNDSALAEHEFVRNVMFKSCEQIVGEQSTTRIKRRTWTTQFADYTQLVPGAFLYLGAELRGSRRTMHTASFDIDESALPIGVAVLAATALTLLEPS